MEEGWARPTGPMGDHVSNAIGAKNTQVNESKVPSLAIDVTELSPRGERALEQACVTGGRLESGKRDTSSKRRANNQEGSGWMGL